MTTTTSTAAPAPTRRLIERPRPPRRRHRIESLYKWLFLVPAVAYLILFFGYPVVKNLVMSFQDYGTATSWSCGRKMISPTVRFHVTNTYLAEELRTGDVAVDGAVSYANWADQLISFEKCQELLPAFCAGRCKGLASPRSTGERQSRAMPGTGCLSAAW